MKVCPQNDKESVLQHGISVAQKLIQLIYFIKKDIPLDDSWKIPEWICIYKEDIRSVLKIEDETLYQFAIFHDCGKPYCKVVDTNNKPHFPNHSDTSYRTWISIFGNPIIGELILHEMEPHCIKSVDIPSYCALNYPMELLLTALASIHANAEMFGGVNSTSFKIKWRQLDRRGKAICKYLFTRENQTNDSTV